jgi:hypothetical protein
MLRPKTGEPRPCNESSVTRELKQSARTDLRLCTDTLHLSRQSYRRTNPPELSPALVHPEIMVTKPARALLSPPCYWSTNGRRGVVPSLVNLLTSGTSYSRLTPIDARQGCGRLDNLDTVRELSRAGRVDPQPDIAARRSKGDSIVTAWIWFARARVVCCQIQPLRNITTSSPSAQPRSATCLRVAMLGRQRSPQTCSTSARSSRGSPRSAGTSTNRCRGENRYPA